MKLYQLIKDLQGEGATKALTHLITLDTLITQLENYVSESDNEARAWDIAVQYKDALKEPVTVSVFNEQQAPILLIKGFKKDAFFGDFVNKDWVRISPIQNQKTGIKICGEDMNTIATCYTFEDLARATKGNPFELEIKDPTI